MVRERLGDVNPLIEEEITIVTEETIEEPSSIISDNIAEDLDDEVLEEISHELIEAFEADVQSRKEYEETIKKGMDLLGLKIEETQNPFPGACSAHHPMMIEGAVQFQSQAIKELFPSGGPVKTQIIGEKTDDTVKQSNRVKEFLNYQITESMEEYFDDFDQMLFYLPIVGSCFKKVYYDEILKRPVSRFIPITDFVVSYNTVDLRTSGRYTHIIRMPQNELKKKQFNGFYRDIEFDMDSEESDNEISQKIQDIEGFSPSRGYQKDGRLTILEMHVDLEIPGYEKDFACPYIVTICKENKEVLSIRENFRENDPDFKRIQHFVHYKFLPGFSFYGFGLIHMLGGLSRTATAALRQLLDAGTLANLPAGFKARGLRIKDDDNPLQPGEFRDVDAPGGSLREGLVPLPYKEPSGTLFQLLGFCVEAGTRFAAIADQKIGDSVGSNAPVGTTMALMERGARVMSAIHKRLHYAQRQEFKLLGKIFAESLPPFYPYDVGENATESLKAEDFSTDIDIIPVSDPNIFSMSQRVTLAQTQLQLAQADPSSHNMYEAYRRMYQALGVKDSDAILPAPQGPQPADPAVENANSLKGQSLIAFRQQNHLAHMDAHRAFMTSSLVKNNPPTMAILQAHIMEHVGLQAREEVEEENAQTVEQTAQQYNGQIPPEVQVQIQEALEQQISEKVAEMTIEMVQEEQEYLDEGSEDPLVNLKQQEINIKAGDLERKSMADQIRFGLDEEKMQQTADIAADRIDSQEDIAQLRANVNLSKQKQPKTVDVNKNVKFDN